MTKELLAEKKRIEKIEKKLQDGANSTVIPCEKMRAW